MGTQRGVGSSGGEAGAVRWDLRGRWTVRNQKLGWWFSSSRVTRDTSPADGLLLREAVRLCR